jgi:hypothetical protein
MTDLVICFDFDGTLVSSGGDIHPDDAAILNAQDRYPATFIPATGRPLHSVRRTFERNGILDDRPIPLPMVLQNGAALYTPEEALLSHHPFADDVQSPLLEAMMNNPEISFLLFTLGKVHVMWPSETTRQMARRFNLETRPFDAGSEDVQFTKAICIAETAKALQVFASDVAALPLEMRYSLETALEINQKDVDKAYGLAKILDALALVDVEVVAAGDGENDLPLLDRADVSFAPETSPQAIRQQVDHVIDVHETGLFAPILEMVQQTRKW